MSRIGVSPRVVVALCVAALATGMALRGFLGTSPPSEQETTAVNGDERGPGPWSFDRGLPVGFARSETGAVAAAASYVTTGQTIVDLSPTQVPAMVHRYAASETARAQIADLTAELDALRDLLADGRGRTRYVQSVLATRVESFTQDRARVAVWSVGVLWRVGAAEPQAGWTTTTYDLVWEDATWKVWSETTASGPAPAPNGGTPPVTAAELDRLLAGYEPWSSP